ncbi:alcohol dehydrogenase catalytic domain-containing protein [Solirubrobacter ginsenosidimutans]|uniref:Alcohol dehydrogenase catalytic domain-containing protein n=1 Tax=Solirubrobacter ginsenosidimutans TaxID=490573 RepID=A0A9X3S4A9_9ACTN|nr:alcohol dehydrogenase catalytic domain-containing protein [Solirubrobacter ginsenosidimutans]MDA0164252.1 alcohol dehydrogenase catalytic domain-containing protein [Solirubrobacter ginsenosidimutans]
MRATMLRSFAEPLTLETVDDPVCGDDGVVVQVRATGVCRSDWHAWMGHDPSIVLPHVPGHELCGVVAEVGPSVRGWTVGDRVTVPFCCGCGVCEPCRLGETQICDQDFQPGFTAWGSFAEFVALPRADLNLVAVPEGLSDVEAASLGCRFMTAWAALHVHAGVRAGEWVAVHGCGGVGLAALMIAAAAGARVVAVDIDAAKLERARALGAEAVASDDVVGSIRDVTGGGAHVSLDALGHPVTCVNSIDCLRKRGRHAQVGLLLGDSRVVPIPMATVIARELRVFGVHGMAVRHYPAMLSAIAGGSVRPGALVAKTIGLEAASDELASMGSFAQEGVTVITPG